MIVCPSGMMICEPLCTTQNKTFDLYRELISIRFFPINGLPSRILISVSSTRPLAKEVALIVLEKRKERTISRAAAISGLICIDKPAQSQLFRHPQLQFSYLSPCESNSISIVVAFIKGIKIRLRKIKVL